LGTCRTNIDNNRVFTPDWDIRQYTKRKSDTANEKSSLCQKIFKFNLEAVFNNGIWTKMLTQRFLPAQYSRLISRAKNCTVYNSAEFFVKPRTARTAIRAFPTGRISLSA
jgi:hypothetical protein